MFGKWLTGEKPTFEQNEQATLVSFLYWLLASLFFL